MIWPSLEQMLSRLLKACLVWGSVLILFGLLAYLWTTSPYETQMIIPKNIELSPFTRGVFLGGISLIMLTPALRVFLSSVLFFRTGDMRHGALGLGAVVLLVLSGVIAWMLNN